jgi:hypothetical protein
MKLTIDAAIEHMLKDAIMPHVVVGPLVWQPSDGQSPKRWYFMISSCGPRGFRCDKVDISPDFDENERKQLRGNVMLALIARPPVVIHDVDDELSAARICEVLWPGERITAIRKAIEKDRT